MFFEFSFEHLFNTLLVELTEKRLKIFLAFKLLKKVLGDV
jgi:hypothetical protein